MILAADIGGTNARFACFRAEAGRLTAVYEKKYPSRSFATPEEALRTFLDDFSRSPAAGKIGAACLSLAGPVVESGCSLVNLGWTCRAGDLEDAFPDIHPIMLCNDLEATGHGIALLPGGDLLSLAPARGGTGSVNRAEESRAILAPGTGLGEALILGGRVFPTEGAHCEFAPRTETEVRLWRFLHRQYGHVSYERVLSGPGLVHLAKFLLEENEIREPDFALRPEEITRRAMEGTCGVCRQALDLFAGILGAEAGNLALKSLATGGVYLGGGIPPKILPKLQDGMFVRAFRDKGRFSGLLEEIPVFVVLNDRAALFGAAWLAARRLYPSAEFALT